MAKFEFIKNEIPGLVVIKPTVSATTEASLWRHIKKMSLLGQV